MMYALLTILVAATPLLVDKVAPIAVFHGVGSGCGSVSNLIEMIKTGLGDSLTTIKCIEIGDGKVSSIYERIEW